MGAETTFKPRGGAREDERRVVNDNRKPLYLVLILDKSGSMSGYSGYTNETGNPVPKIDQLNDGVDRVIKSLQSFELANPLFKIYYQIIALDSYGQAMFEEFQPVAKNTERMKLEAYGATNMAASLKTLNTYLTPEKLRDDRPERQGKAYNKAVSVIMMSDGEPTDGDGYSITFEQAKGIFDEFKKDTQDISKNLDFYTISVGAGPEGEKILRYIADGDENSVANENSRFYDLKKTDSIAQALDFVTRVTIAQRAEKDYNAGDDEDDDDLDELFDDLDVAEDTDNGDTVNTDDDDLDDLFTDDDDANSDDDIDAVVDENDTDDLDDTISNDDSDDIADNDDADDDLDDLDDDLDLGDDLDDDFGSGDDLDLDDLGDIDDIDVDIDDLDIDTDDDTDNN